jgi:predicted ATP-dependent serine protease
MQKRKTRRKVPCIGCGQDTRAAAGVCKQCDETGSCIEYRNDPEENREHRASRDYHGDTIRDDI